MAGLEPSFASRATRCSVRRPFKKLVHLLGRDVNGIAFVRRFNRLACLFFIF